jgi:hypothetical protein
MTDQSFTTTITVPQSPATVFAAIQNPSLWWTQIDGRAEKVGDIFTHRFGDAHRCKAVVEETIADRKIVWGVLEHYLSFTENKAPWLGTKMVFDIVRKGDQTELTFTHVGLVPEEACYEDCSNGWTSVIHEDLGGVITGGDSSEQLSIRSKRPIRIDDGELQPNLEVRLAVREG